MKQLDMKSILMGISAVTLTIGVGLLGLTLGAYWKSGVSMDTHPLFGVAIHCINAGVLNIFLLLLLNLNPAQDEK